MPFSTMTTRLPAGLPAPEAADIPPLVPDFADEPFLLFRPPDLVTPVGSYASLADAVAVALADDVIEVLPGAPSSGNTVIGVDNLTLDADGPYSAAVWMSGSARRFTVEGTAFVDVAGTAGNDTITVGDGGGRIVAREGHDHLIGGAGNDLIYGNNDNDTLEAGAGNDTLMGGVGNDLFISGTGNGFYNGGSGFDSLDFLNVAPEGITVNLNHTATQFVSPTLGLARFVDIEGIAAASQYDDFLVGNEAGNFIAGDHGDDEIYGLGGADRLYGGWGNDLIEGSGGNDTLFGDEGTDTVSYYHAPSGVTASLFSSSATGAYIGTDAIYGFENLYGSLDHPDSLTGDELANLLVGFDGDDTLSGSVGNDTLYGMQGNDVLQGGRDGDLLQGDEGNDVFIYVSTEDSTPLSRDTIADFQSGLDQIDTTGLDADEAMRGRQDFVFIGQAAFSGTPGELRFVTNGTDGFVLGDTDGDGMQELEIRLLGITSMEASDFFL